MWHKHESKQWEHWVPQLSSKHRPHLTLVTMRAPATWNIRACQAAGCKNSCFCRVPRRRSRDHAAADEESPCADRKRRSATPAMTSFPPGPTCRSVQHDNARSREHCFTKLEVNLRFVCWYRNSDYCRWLHLVDSGYAAVRCLSVRLSVPWRRKTLRTEKPVARG